MTSKKFFKCSFFKMVEESAQGTPLFLRLFFRIFSFLLARCRSRVCGLLSALELRVLLNFRGAASCLVSFSYVCFLKFLFNWVFNSLYREIFLQFLLSITQRKKRKLGIPLINYKFILKIDFFDA